MKKIVVVLIFAMASELFGMTLNEILQLSVNAATIYKARDEILNMMLSDPSSAAVYNAARIVYSKLKILQSSDSTPVQQVAHAILEGNKDDFYLSLASTRVKHLPEAFSLVFNILDVDQDYVNFFSHIFDSDFAGALDYLRKIKYLYKIPHLTNYLPQEDTTSLWSFFAQGIQLAPGVFDDDAAKFFADILTSYQLRSLYMKTYVWLSGLSVQQAQLGLSVVEFESEISHFSTVKMDPNLLQWKYMTSSYLSLYTSITNSTRNLSVAKNLKAYVEYAPTFFKAVEEFPAQYRIPLSKQLSTYLDLLNQRLANSNVTLSSTVVNEIRNLVAEFPHDLNSTKLMALTLGQNVESVSSNKKSVQTPANDIGSTLSYGKARFFLPFVALLFALFIPRVRLSFYRLLRLKGMEMRFYFKKLSNSPAESKWHLELANFYERIGKFEEARREYSLAMKLMKIGGNIDEDR